MSMTDTATLERRLAELEEARHALLTGKARVSVSAAGRSVTYAKADLGALNAAIAELRSALGRGGRRAIGIGGGMV
jgi:HAMP domain-containing protein